MKIGIVTIAHGANYGNRLQNYAVQEVFKSIGCKTETIAYDTEYISTAKLRFIHFIKAKLLKIKIYHLQKNDKFQLFNKRKIKFSKKKYVSPESFDISGYDMFSVGSDQVWNLYFSDTIKYKDLLFLTFVPSEKKFAYSASIGAHDIPEKFIDFFKDAVNEFKHISVRESVGSNIIKTYCNRETETTIDPTLMLSKKHWTKFSKKPKTLPKKEYIAVYFLANLPEDVQKYIKTVSEYYGYDIVRLNSGASSWTEIPDPKYFCADPQEFVYYIANATLVITDSFHASVFSTIFKKPFRVFERKDLNMYSRIQELFDKIHLGKWCIGNTEEYPEKLLEVDYTGVDEAIVKEQQKALNYLKKALNI